MSSTTSPSAVRRPRLRMLAGGRGVVGAVRAEVENNGYLSTDKFRAAIAVGPDTDLTPAWWSSQTDVRIEIQIGFLPDGAPEGQATWQSLLIGDVDHVEYDPVRGEIALTGRDLSHLLVDAKTQETFANQTSSQIATTLAKRHGLTPVVTATSTLVGQYYKQEHARITLGNLSRTTTEWELLTFLAQEEGFDVWVQGATLHFGPKPDSPATYAITYQPGPPPVTNVNTIHLERSLTLAKDIQVTVVSHDSKHKAAHTKTVRASGVAKGGGGHAQNYTIYLRNATPDQMLKAGLKHLEELTQHERVVMVHMPGELDITTRWMVSLSGTGTSWDQAYYIADLTREISFDEGFTQRLRLKNSSPRDQATVI